MSDPHSAPGAPRRFHVLLGIVLAGLFLFLAFSNVNVPELARTLASVDLTYLPVILLLLGLFFLLKAIRWAYILRPVRKLGTFEVFPALMIGFAGNNVLPAHLGEFVRIFVLSRRYGLAISQVFATVVVERLFDFLTVVGLLAFSLQFAPLSAELKMVRTGGYLVGAVCLVVFAVALASALNPPKARKVIESLGRFIPSKLRERAVTVGSMAVEGLGALRKPRLFFLISFLTVAGWVVNGLCLYLCAVSFPVPGWPSPVAGLLLASVMALGITLPSAPGYIGTTQLCFVIALGAFKINKTTALSGSVYAFLTAYIPVTVTGLFFAWYMGFSLRTLKRTAGGGDSGKEGS